MIGQQSQSVTRVIYGVPTSGAHSLGMMLMIRRWRLLSWRTWAPSGGNEGVEYGKKQGVMLLKAWIITCP
ncbi:hypothetical protein LINPERHAP1_LOCUS12811 [Linum perenne]